MVWYHRSDLATQVPHGFTRPSQLHEDTAVEGDAQVLAGSPQSQEQKYSQPNHNRAQYNLRKKIRTPDR